MKNRNGDFHHRRPKTTAERRANQDVDHKVYVRGKRTPRRLPNSYDDLCSNPPRKSWKWQQRRKKQYHEVQVIKHRVEFSADEWEEAWAVEEYLRKNNIRYHIEETRGDPIHHRREIQERVGVGHPRPKYHFYWGRDENKRLIRVRGHQIGWEYWEYKWVGTGKFKEWTTRDTISVEVSWWYDKDIGLDYILAKVQHYRYRRWY